MNYLQIKFKEGSGFNALLTMIKKSENFEDGRMTPMSSGPFVGKINNGLTNYNHNEERVFDFDNIYDIAKRSINTPPSRGRIYI